MVKKKRNYKREILEILNKHESVLGFNNLCEGGNFHKSSLQKNLNALRESGEIIIISSSWWKTQYFIPKTNYEVYFQRLFPEIIKLEKKIKNQTGKAKINSIKKIIKEILAHRTSIEFLLNYMTPEEWIHGEQNNFLNVMKYKLDTIFSTYIYALPYKNTYASSDLPIAKDLKNCQRIWKRDSFSKYRQM